MVEGRYIYGDAEYSRIFLNKVIIYPKPRKIKSKGYRARIRDRVFDRENVEESGFLRHFNKLVRR
ncbi:MAG: hypothetical protein DRP01_09640 [Archaeoglobales archaeon]|nr:MAG: hypothetical protein DRP01_09640 [Archaeoglobales archaeon]